MAQWIQTDDGQLINTRFLRIIERSGQKILGYIYPAGEVTLRRMPTEATEEDYANAMAAMVRVLDAKPAAPREPMAS